MGLIFTNSPRFFVPTDDLYQLIKSLSRNEKGYFKKYARSIGGSDVLYVKLFEVIDALPDYDETLLQKKVRRESFAKHLAATKNYLFQLILRSLRAYHQHHNDYLRINAHIEYAELLVERCLYKAAQTELDKARQIAQTQNLDLKLVECFHVERPIFLETGFADWENTLFVAFDQTQQDLQNLADFHQLMALYLRLYHFWRKQRILRSSEDAIWLDGLMAEIRACQSADKGGFSWKNMHLTCLMIERFIRNDDESAFDYMKAVVDLWNEHPHIIAQQPVRYINTLNNFFSICVRSEKPEPIEYYIEKFDEQILEYHEMARFSHFKVFTLFRVAIMEMRHQYDYLLPFLEKADQQYQTFGSRANPVDYMMFKVNFMIYCFMEKQYEKALTFADDIINLSGGIDLRQDVRAAARLYRLIFHYELGNTLLLEYAIRSVRRYLEKEGQLYAIERLFLKYFNKLAQCPDRHSENTLLADLLTKTEQLTQEKPFEANFLETFHFQTWIQAHLAGMSIRQWQNWQKTTLERAR